MTTELTSFHFLHNPNCDCGIVEAYTSKKQAVQATRRYRERCLGHRRKARKWHAAPYSIRGHSKSRKSMFGDKAREKERSVHSGNTSDDFTTHSDLPKDESRTESVNGETNALQLCESFKQAGRDFAAELDGYHIFKTEIDAFRNGEYTGVLDPKLWTERLFDFRDRMGIYASSLLDNVSMAETPMSWKCSKQFRSTRASAIYFWWRICGMIEDFCIDCEERKQYGLVVEWEHECFVEDVLKMKELVGNMWYALGMVLWKDMEKPEGFRWNVIHIHLNGQSTKLPSLEEYTISQEVFSRIPNTNQLPCLSFERNQSISNNDEIEAHIDATTDILAKVVIINQEAADFLEHSDICLLDLQQSVRVFFNIADGPDVVSILEHFEELVTGVDGSDGSVLLECLCLLIDGTEGLSKLKPYADVVEEGKGALFLDSRSSPVPLESESTYEEYGTSSPTDILDDDCSPFSDKIQPLISPTMTASSNSDRIDYSFISASKDEELGKHAHISPLAGPSSELDSVISRPTKSPNDEKLQNLTKGYPKGWDFDIPLSTGPVEEFINRSLERPTMPIVMHMRAIRPPTQDPTKRKLSSKERLDLALEALRTLDVDAILRARRERWGDDGEGGVSESGSRRIYNRGVREAYYRRWMRAIQRRSGFGS